MRMRSHESPTQIFAWKRTNELNINILLIAEKKIARYIPRPILLGAYDIYGIPPWSTVLQENNDII